MASSRILGTALLGTMMVCLLVLSSGAPAMAASVTKLEQSKLQLSITSIASKLPADGKEYSAIVQLQTASDGKPVEAPNDVAITLLTSDNTVALPQDKVLLKEGESLVRATIATTQKAGAAEITAIAQGVSPGVLDIATVTLGSLKPTKLAVYAGASSFIPNPAYSGKMYVQLLNSVGVPAAADGPATVYLSSGNPKIGSVPKSVSIPQGATGATFDFTPTSQQGATTVTASANGLAPAQTSVKTSGSIGSQLVVEFAPPSMPAPFGYYSMLTIQLQDAEGNPALAKQAISVSLSSSDPNVAQVPSFLSIAPGHSYAVDKVSSNGKIGDAIITASSQGLASGSSTISTFAHVEGQGDSSKIINIYALPSAIVSNNGESSYAVVQVTDTSGRVYTSKSYLYTPIIISSSDSSLGTVDKNLVPETTYATTTFASSFRQGKVTIGASANGYSPGAATIDLVGFTPTSLQIAQMPGIILANNAVSGSVMVGLFDERGRPAPAQQDVLFHLSSSNPDIVSIQSTETIPAGKSYARVEAHPTNRPGTATITAQAPGFAAGSVEFKTVGTTGDSSQYKLGVSTVPKLPADGRTYDAVFVQLQDSNGNPVPAASDVHAVLSLSSSLAGSIQEKVTIQKGTSYAIAKFTASTTPIKFTVAASSTGFGTVEADLQTTVQPLTIVPSSQLPTKGQLGSIPVAINVFSGAYTVRNATVQVGGLAANTTNALTDAAGHAESMYVPTQPGRNSIIFTVTKPGYEMKTASYGILLDQNVNISVNAVTEGGNSVQLSAKVSGPAGTKTLALGSATGVQLQDIKWGPYKISVPEEFATENAQYKFVRWSDGFAKSARTTDVIGDSTFAAIYSVKYLVSVSSVHGMVSGGGYYPEGEKATISVDPTSTGTILVQSAFAGWTGDVRSGSATAQLTVDGPKTIRAEWNDNYLVVFALAGAAGAGGFVAYYKIIKPKKDARAKEKAPDLDWYKS